jgi:hypothetical protein
MATVWTATTRVLGSSLLRVFARHGCSRAPDVAAFCQGPVVHASCAGLPPGEESRQQASGKGPHQEIGVEVRDDLDNAMLPHHHRKAVDLFIEQTSLRDRRAFEAKKHSLAIGCQIDESGLQRRPSSRSSNGPKAPFTRACFDS